MKEKMEDGRTLISFAEKMEDEKDEGRHKKRRTSMIASGWDEGRPLISFAGLLSAFCHPR